MCIYICKHTPILKILVFKKMCSKQGNKKREVAAKEHCNTLQYTATHCNTLQHTATHCNSLQYTTTHCNILQHTATHCNTLLETG